MTRSKQRFRAVSLAVLMILSVVAGSVAFTGSTAGVDTVSDESKLSPTDVDESTTETFDFNYSFTGVNTSDDTTLSLSFPSDFTVDSVDAQMENASGSGIKDASPNSNGIEVTATPGTSTVYLNGTVDVTTPSVGSDTTEVIDITGTDADGDSDTRPETITVRNTDFTVSAVSGSDFFPTSAGEETFNRYQFNYSFTNVDTSGDTTLSLSVPSDVVIESTDARIEDASGSEITKASVNSGNDTIEVTATPGTSTVYLSGGAKITTPSVNKDDDKAVNINGSDNDGDTTGTTATLTVENAPVEVLQTNIGTNALDPSRVDEQTNNRHSFNYTFRNISVQSSTTFSVTGPSGSTITSADLAVQNASGENITTSPSISGNKLTISADSSTSTAYLAGSFNLTSPEVPEGQEQKTYNVDINSTDPGGSGSATALLQVDFVGGQAGDPELESAIQYVQSDGTPAVEVAFSEDVDDFDRNYDLYVDGEGQLGGSQIQSDSEAQGRAVIELDQSYSQPMTLQLASGIQDPDGNALVSDDTGNTSVQFAPTSVTAGESTNAYQGANVSIVTSASGTGVQIEGTDDGNNYFFDGSTGTNSRVFVFSTADREVGDYEADIDGEGTADITVRGLELSVGIDDTNVTTVQAIEGTIEAQAGDRPIRLELFEENGDPVDAVDDRIISLSGQGEYQFSYDLVALELETGEYRIRATDTTSGVSVESNTTTVREASDTEATFPSGTITESRGDVAAIPIALGNTREATLTIGGDDLGFEANVTVRDDDKDGQVTVYFDTYAASTVSEGPFDGSTDLFGVGDDDEIVDGTVSLTVSNLLDATSYDMSVEAEGRETDIDLLVLEPRETTAIRTWTAPQSRYGDLDTASDIRDGEGTWLTRTDDVAVGDTVVYEIEASGLEGPLDARNKDTVTSEFYDFTNASGPNPAAGFAVAQQDPGPNQQPLLLRLSGSNSRVVADSANDSYYVVTRTGSDGPSAVEDDDGDGVIDPGETDSGEISTDDDLRASFTVFGDDENDRDLTADGEDEVVETTHSLTEAELSMSEPFNVTETSGQDVFGEATVAPGTELRVRVRSGDSVRPSFLKTAETTVDADGQFLVTLSFNDTSPGDSYEVVVDDTGPASELTVEGTVQPVIRTPTTDTPAETSVITSTPTRTATSTPTTTTTSTSTSTSPPATTTTAIPTVQTSTTTPGFGIAAAAVALAAAALLALRRN